MNLHVYNLEFPEYIDTLSIAGYKFTRVKNYREAFAELQHLVEVIGGEFPRKLKTGSHQWTATVKLPSKEKHAFLPWKSKKPTRFDDILLLLSLFTGRSVFAIRDGEEGYPIRRDHRHHFSGGQLVLSKLTIPRWQNKKTNKILTDEQIKGIPIFEYNRIDLGLEKTIEQILNTMATEEWKKEYGTGYFLFTFRQALQQPDIEPAFLLCWTVWEHLFTLHNQEWLDDTSIYQTSGDKKIAFILNRYFLLTIDEKARKEIKRITNARNRIIHYGKIPQNVDIDEMVMFIRLTEQIIAIVLRLTASNAFNSFERLKKFLNKT